MTAVAAPVRYRPALMSGPMVRAALDDRKTHTRRVMLPQPSVEAGHASWRPRPKERGQVAWAVDAKPAGACLDQLVEWCPYGQSGDRLWVRETWADTNGESGPMISYRAGGDRFLVDESYPVDYSRYPNCTFAMWGGDLRRGAPDHAWRSPIHMPRWASRLTLEITNVRVERVQDIDGHGAQDEGINAPPSFARGEFASLWDSLNSPRGYGWDANPWVWVIEFRRVEAPV